MKIISSRLKTILLFYFLILPFSYLSFFFHSYFLSYSFFSSKIFGYFIGALPLLLLIAFAFKGYQINKKDFSQNLFMSFLLGIISALAIFIISSFLFQNTYGNFPNNFLFGVFYWLFLSFSQEVFFRGCLFKELRKNFSLIFSLIISSLLFALWHITIPFSGIWLTLSGLIRVLLAGFIWGLIYFKTDNLLAPIISHFLVGIFLSQF